MTLQIPDRDERSYALANTGAYVPAIELTETADTPRGLVKRRRLESARTYPDNTHDYTVYASAQIASNRPAHLLVVLDGDMCEAELSMTTVLDNLIHAGELPAMVAVFVNPGSVGPGLPIYGGSDNRSVEYDAVDDTYSRFLLEELLPTVEAHYAITTDPARRGIVGVSSSGSAAFGVAWHRPESFGRVLSFVGSFVDIRGANQYASMIRRAERKPLRVFLQTGSNDLDTVFGSWPIANQDMFAALKYREYDVHLEFGRGGHGLQHAAAVLPDALRWLWRREVESPSG